MVNLKELNLSNNSISTTNESISKLNKLEILDLSSNTSFSNMDEALVTTLKKLNLSNTAITKIDYDGENTFVKLHNCRNLIDLRLADCKLTDSSLLFKTEKVTNGEGKTEYLAIMRNIETLDLSGTGITSFSSLKTITNLKELYLKNNGISNVSSIYDLENLEYVNLDNNKISNISGIVKTKTSDGVTVIEKVLKAKQISMKNNQISDISYLSFMDEIDYLDLSENKIQNINPIEKFSFSKGLNLKNQQVDMAVFKKSNNENQYIILYNILQSAKNPSSKAYNVNARYTTVGVEINSNSRYQSYPYINAIITPDKTAKDELSVTIHGGVTDGSTINFKISTSTSAIDSILFKDENLDKAIYEDLVDRKRTTDYIARAPLIINISRSSIASIRDFQLTPEAGCEIEDLTGLSNFSNLTTLNLANNHISNDNEIKYLKNLTTLNFANNRLNNNYTSIEELYSLQNLNLDGNNIQSLDSINKLLTNINDNKKSLKLVNLSLSNNKLTDISVLSNISTLTNLYLANNNIANIEPLKTNTSLKILDISGNQISDISALSNLPSLHTLNASNNIIRNINPISSLTLYTLDLSSNVISDISVLQDQTSLETLKINNNRIEDISAIESLLIKNEFNAKQQKITSSLSTGDTGDVEIELPTIFLSSRNADSKIYTSSDYELDNCSLSSDGSKIVVNADNLKNNFAKIKIIGGNAANTMLTIGPALTAEIEYSPESKTNTDVTATISFNRTGVTVLNNDGNKTYTFDKNGEFTFEFIDENGFGGTKTATVDWIDKVAPIATVEYNKTEDNIEVTIVANEKIQEVSGWEYVDAEKTKIKKVFSKDDKNSEVTIKDEVGNETKVKIEIETKRIESIAVTTPPNKTSYFEGDNFDKTGMKVTATYSDKTTKEITDYIITDETNLTVGKTTVTISYTEDNITVTTTQSITVTAKEEKPIKGDKYKIEGTYIKNIDPKTTIAKFKENISEGYTAKILKSDKTSEIGANDKIGTGMWTQIYKGDNKTGEYEIIVTGDCNGNGDVNVSDLTTLMVSIAESKSTKPTESKILNGAKKIAVDLSGDNKLSVADITKLSMYIASNK